LTKPWRDGTERKTKSLCMRCLLHCLWCFLALVELLFSQSIAARIWASFVLHGSVFFLGQGEITIDGKYHKTGGKSDEQIVSETPITADNMIVDTWGV
jgi:hypothetical protein